MYVNFKLGEFDTFFQHGRGPESLDVEGRGFSSHQNQRLSHAVDSHRDLSDANLLGSATLRIGSVGGLQGMSRDHHCRVQRHVRLRKRRVGRCQVQEAHQNSCARKGKDLLQTTATGFSFPREKSFVTKFTAEIKFSCFLLRILALFPLAASKNSSFPSPSNSFHPGDNLSRGLRRIPQRISRSGSRWYG